ncbi:MAG: hypothetical protein AAGE52_05605, partial [Myxococcota bacterium]
DLGSLSRGRQAVAIVRRGLDCTITAYGCAIVSPKPGSSAALTLVAEAGPGCNADQACADGRCVEGGRDAAIDDGGVDAGDAFVDASERDAFDGSVPRVDCDNDSDCAPPFVTCEDNFCALSATVQDESVRFVRMPDPRPRSVTVAPLRDNGASNDALLVALAVERSSTDVAAVLWTEGELALQEIFRPDATDFDAERIIAPRGRFPINPYWGPVARRGLETAVITSDGFDPASWILSFSGLVDDVTVAGGVAPMLVLAVDEDGITSLRANDPTHSRTTPLTDAVELFASRGSRILVRHADNSLDVWDADGSSATSGTLVEPLEPLGVTSAGPVAIATITSNTIRVLTVDGSTTSLRPVDCERGCTADPPTTLFPFAIERPRFVDTELEGDALLYELEGEVVLSFVSADGRHLVALPLGSGIAFDGNTLSNVLGAAVATASGMRFTSIRAEM